MRILTKCSRVLVCLAFAMFIGIETGTAGLKFQETASEYEPIIYNGPPLAPLVPSLSGATTVTTQEAGVDAIYSSAPFGADPIDMDYAPTITVNGIANIQSFADWISVTTNPVPVGDTINIWYVDTIDWCGGFNTAIVGCALIGGQLSVVEEAFAASGFGTELIAHEFGHNLALDHVAVPNLMTGFLNGNVTLTGAQAATVQANSKVQGVAPNRFVDIQPISIAAIPEPSAFLLLGLVGAVLVACRIVRLKLAAQ